MSTSPFPPLNPTHVFIPPVIIQKPTIVFKNILFAEAVRTVMLENTPDSYRFVVMDDKSTILAGAGGYSRHAVDAPAIAAQLTDRHNICSMSKTITAVAVLALLQQKNLTPDDLVAPFFPPDWTLSDDVGKLTFRDFLTHRTGFWFDKNGAVHQDASDYAGMRAIMAQTPHNPIKAGFDYRNINFAIFRVLLNYLNAYNRFTRKVELNLPQGGSPDQILANGYIDLVNKYVLAPSGVAPAGCDPATLHATGTGNPFGVYPVLSYPFHDNTSKGIDVGNQTSNAGAQGWCLSVVDIARVLQTALFTEVILSEKSRNFMLAGGEDEYRGMGLDRSKDLAGSPVFGHGAWIPFTDPPKAGDAMLAGWCLYFQAQRLIVVALCNTGHDPVQQNKRNWDQRVTDAYATVYAAGSPGI